jgi:transposase-like protein
MPGTHAIRACQIEHIGKQRNGRPRFWCKTHRASATGRYGARLETCEGAYRDQVVKNVLELDAADFPGGVALWGAVAPVYDTTNLPVESAIHVHARKASEGNKEIDATFDAVAITYTRDLLEKAKATITADVAVNYYISRFLNRPIQHLFCTHCGEIHLDAGYFAVKPHRQHLCHACGRHFRVESRAVSNPIALIREKCDLPKEPPAPVRPERPLQINQTQYPGGLQIWASNPALVWTSIKPEEEGIHVHAFAADGQIVLDETYSSVTIDDIELDEKHVKYFMAQSALVYLRNKITSLNCPKCNRAHFDQDDLAFEPHAEHGCDYCGERFKTSGRRRLVVSNPFVATRGRLMQLRQKGGQS